MTQTAPTSGTTKPPAEQKPAAQKMDGKKFPALLILDERSEEYLQVKSPNGR